MKKTLPILFFLVLFFGFVFYFMPSTEDSRCESYRHFRIIKFNGKVFDKYIDKSDHSFPKVFVRDLSQPEHIILNMTFDTTLVYNSISLGDSLVKNFDSDTLYIYNGGERKFKVLDFACKK